MKTKQTLQTPAFLIVTMLFCILLSACNQTKFTLETATLKLAVDAKGNITSMQDKSNGKEYVPASQAPPLLALYKDSIYTKPNSADYDAAKNLLTLGYENGSKAIIKINTNDTYLRMQLQSLEPRNGTQAIVWGPYTTTLADQIGETICVVSDSSYAIGMQALEINTIEGLPNGDDNNFGAATINPLPGQDLPDSLKNRIGEIAPSDVNTIGDLSAFVRLTRGTAAVKKSFGSQLQLFARDRRIPHTINSGDKLQFVDSINVDFVGSAVALFGCPTAKTLDAIEQIELKENLPHPMLDGVWIKRSKIPGEAYLMYEGDDMNKGIEYAKACGFKLVHAGDVFKSWGHFDLTTKRFPAGAAGIKQLTDKGWKDSIAFGVHTLTMFTGIEDPYVTPLPNDSLCKKGSSVLVKNIAATDSIIYIKDPTYFKHPDGTHTVKIGKELINYREVSDAAPWALLDCKRAQFGSTASAHVADSKIDKLVNNSYGGFYPDIYLQDAFAKRLAAVCNETGIGLMDFDGYGGESTTGQGSYAAAKFISEWYKNLDHYVLVCGAGPSHYYWHIYSFMNWGEPWYNALRESQVNYRIENQRFFKRNLMPHMLGWFKVEKDYRPEEIEWIQARSAAFDAGYLLNVESNIEKNGYKNDLFTAVREWQKARNSKAFSAAQLEALSNPKNEYHLEKTGEESWNLFPVTLARNYQHKYRQTQTGEPVHTEFKFTNNYAAQPLRFYITAQPVAGNATATITQLKLLVNNYQTLELKVPLKAGDRIVCDGTAIYVCDATWNKLTTLTGISIPTVNKGANQVAVSSAFSSEQAPMLEFEFKMVGVGEKVGK